MHMQLRKKEETCDFTKKVCKGTNILTNFFSFDSTSVSIAMYH